MSARTKTCAKCARKIERAGVSGLCIRHWRERQASRARSLPPAPILVQRDTRTQRLTADLADVRKRYAEALRTIDQQRQRLDVQTRLAEGVDTFTIAPQKGSGTSEATPVIVASDWHAEERVGGEVNDLNRYSLDIAKTRATRFFQASLRLIRLLQQDVRITTAVVALLGDFISNDIHEEFPEINALQPTHAIAFAQGLLISGFEFLLNHSKLNLVMPCHSGNHARTTKTTRFTTEAGHSLEHMMYLALQDHFRTEPRLTFIVPESMHSYMKVYETTARFQHGHAIKYQGGVGGIFIPAYKAIAQWNKGKHADLDVFAHFHQLRDGGNFISNGSLIGYNAFAMAIKADFEPPRQALFLLDKTRGRTATWPILVTDK